MSEWMMSETVNDGYPYISDLDTTPLPELLYEGSTTALFTLKTSVNSGYPHLQSIGADVPVAISKPYPDSCMILKSTVNDGYPFFTKLQDDSIPDTLTRPYPHSIFVMEDDYYDQYPFIDGNEQKPILGGFRFITNLELISIPPELESIGHKSFELTGLTSVIIDTDCAYESDSFPPGCQVTHEYPEED